MARIFYDRDADLSIMKEQLVAVIGYGNQGRSQALNLHDSGFKVIVGNGPDKYREIAEKDGMVVINVEDAVEIGNVVMFVIPDEVQPEVYKSVEKSITPGKLMIFSHGYNIFYKLIEPPDGVDVGLVAPRMIGEGVRICYKEGFPTLVAVERDATGTAWQRTLAIASGIGGMRKGAWETTFEEETIIDLFGEQAGGAAQLRSTLFSYETLVEAGYNPEVILLELYASGEMVEVMRGVTRYGLLESLRMHSPTSQYGQMSRATTLVPDGAKDTLRSVLENLRNGEFAREWAQERSRNYQTMEKLRSEFASHPMFETERRVRQALLKDSDGENS